MHTQFAPFSWNISFALFLYLLMLRFSGINYGDIFRNIFGNYLSYFNSLTFSVFKYILQPCGRRDISNCILRLSSILFDQFLKRLNNYINGILFFLHCILPFGNNHLSNKQFILFNCLKISTSLGKKMKEKKVYLFGFIIICRFLVGFSWFQSRGPKELRYLSHTFCKLFCLTFFTQF